MQISVYCMHAFISQNWVRIQSKVADSVQLCSNSGLLFNIFQGAYSKSSVPSPHFLHITANPEASMLWPSPIGAQHYTNGHWFFNGWWAPTFAKARLTFCAGLSNAQKVTKVTPFAFCTYRCVFVKLQYSVFTTWSMFLEILTIDTHSSYVEGFLPKGPYLLKHGGKSPFGRIPSMSGWHIDCVQHKLLSCFMQHHINTEITGAYFSKFNLIF